ncbi:MAG: hypothetical protein ABL952_16225 [Pyrinomonadaceae bacterium]
MLQNVLISVLIFLFSGVFALVFGQTPDAAIKPTYFSGDVAAISATTLSITTKTGTVSVALSDKTAFKKVSAETRSLTTAIAGALADVVAGDQVTVSALQAADGKTMNARTVYFVSKADILAKNAKDVAEWQRRGIAGKITAVNAQTNQITVDIRGLTGSTTMTVTPKADAKFIRYAPDSERFDEAKPSTFTEIKAGDTIRALGDKNTEGTAMTAETVLTGAFLTVAGTIVSTDPAKNEVVIKDLQTNKDVTVALGTTSVMKKFPSEMAERMAGMQAGGGAAMGGPGGVQIVRPPTQGGQGQPAAGAGQGQPGGNGPRGMGGRPGGGGGIDDMLERFPSVTIADLKAGDMIAVSSTKGVTPDRIRAIKLLAGVEPFIRMAQAQAGRNGGRGVDFNIPGLDGAGFP